MLSSHISSVSQTSISPLLLQSSTPILRSTSTLPRRRCSNHQVRSRSFVRWYLSDPKLQKLERELHYRRHQEHMAKHMEYCLRSRRVSHWGNIEQLNQAVKDAHKKQDGGIEDSKQSAYDKFLNSRDGLYDLFRARSRALRQKFNISNITSQDTRTSSSALLNTFGSENESQNQSNANPEPEYDIDPITNRKVFKIAPTEDVRKPINIPVKAYEEYMAQLQPRLSRDAHSKAKSSTKADPTRVAVEEVETVDSYKPYFAYEPNGKQPDPVQKDPVQEGLKEFDAGENYQPYFAYEPDGKLPDTAQKGLKEHETVETAETVETYKPYCAYEPDGKTPDPVQEGLKDYETVVSYQPYFAYEPNGKRPDPVEEGLKEYETGVSYEPYFAYEPDGKIPCPVTESSEASDNSIHSCPVQQGLKDYDQKVSYGPVLYKEPDGKFPDEQDPVREGLKDYDSVTSYGIRPLIERAKNIPTEQKHVSNGLQDFDNKVVYGSTENTKDTSLSNSSANESAASRAETDTREDLDLLRPSDVRAASGFLKDSKKETEADKLAKRRDLEEQYQKLTIENSELQNIASHLKGRIDSRLAEVSSDSPVEVPKRKMSGSFVRDFPEEFEEKWIIGNDGSKTLTPKRRVDAWGYDKTPKGLELSYEREVQQSANEFIDGLAPIESFASKRDTPRIQTSLDRSNTPKNEKRNTTQDCEVITDASDNPIKEVREIRARYADEPYSETSQGLETVSAEHIKLQHELDPYSKEPQGLETHYAEERRLENEIDPYSKKPQGLETSFAEERRLESEIDPYSKKPQGLETSFAEEIRLEKEIDPYSKKPQGLETSFAEEIRLEKEIDPYSKKPQGLETSFAEEIRLEKEIDPYSKKPQGLETSYAEECASQQDEDLPAVTSSYSATEHGENASTEDILSEQAARSENNRNKKIMKQKDLDLIREVRGIYEDRYGKIDSKHRQVPEDADNFHAAQYMGTQVPESTSAAAAPEPTLYKILAYDSTMQSISTAETSSIVPDSASPLTPSEALLRLSNPAKFFPHFEYLQAQGYEILSGSGDVLVFRKVRSAEPSSYLDRATNPIDGMRTSPIATTGNFASPTGFVNHDIPGGEDNQFKSNIDVRREEDVFSGKSGWKEDAKRPRRKKMTTAKKMLVGAIWVGGLSYSLGVVSEYFKTGGIDGLGPQGF